MSTERPPPPKTSAEERTLPLPFPDFPRAPKKAPQTMMHVVPRQRRTFAEYLKIARNEKGLSFAEVASRIGRHKSYIEDLESGAMLPDPRVIVKLIALFPSLGPFRHGGGPIADLRAVPDVPAPPPAPPTPVLLPATSETAPPMPPAQAPAPMPAIGAFPSFLRWMRLISTCRASPAMPDFLTLLQACEADGVSVRELLEAFR